MSIQFGNNLKVFVTTNTDFAGTVNLTGFNSTNTREISIIKDSLSATQQKTFQYISNNNLIDSTSQLESLSGSGITLGDLSFSTYLNSSSSGPYDSWIWNSLINEASYPGESWTLDLNSVTLILSRKFSDTKTLGLVVVSKDTTYVFDGLQVKNSTLSFDLSNLTQTNWNFNFIQVRLLESIVIDLIPEVVVGPQYQPIVSPSWELQTMPSLESSQIPEYLGSDGSRIFTHIKFTSTARVFYSDDYGLSWTETDPVTRGSGTPFYGNGVWIIPRNTVTGQVLRSVDGGLTWLGSSATGGTWIRGAYGNGIYLLTPNTSSSTITRSVNGGVTWSSQSILSGFKYNIVFTEDRFVISISSSALVLWSLDGVTWTQVTTPLTGTKELAYGNGVVVGVLAGVSDRVPYIYSLNNGQTWLTGTLPINGVWNSITFGSDRFLLTSSTPNVSYTSIDGINWVQNNISGTTAQTAFSSRTTYAFPYFVNTAAASASPNRIRRLKTHELVDPVVSDNSDGIIIEQSFSGELSGTVPKLNLASYKVCPARTMLLSVYDTNNTKLGSVAVTDLNLNISNNLVYLEKTGIDRTSLGYNYVGSGDLVVEGSFGFYSRKSGSYANILLNDILNNLTNSDIDTKYTFVIELLVNNTTKLCDIKLVNCVVSVSSEFSNVLINKVDFKVLSGTTELNSFIKFYT